MLCGVNREDVVQAALTVERWCLEHKDFGNGCDCPFSDCVGWCCLVEDTAPFYWRLEEYLRERGIKNG